MPEKPNDLLLLAGKVLTILMQIFVAIGAVTCAILLPVVLIFQGDINAEMAQEFGNAVGDLPIIAFTGLMAFLIGFLSLIFFFFGKLRAIIGTVGDGDPFDPDNAERLSAMAWIMLACQALLIPIGGLGLIIAKWAEPMENTDVTVDAGFDLSGILLVIILFILARVFKHGAAMREDLEGTV